MFDVKMELDRLRLLSVRQLQEEFALVTGEVARSNNRVFLIKRIAWRKQAIAMGGLSERAMAKAAELAREDDLRVRPRPELHAAFAGVDREGIDGVPSTKSSEVAREVPSAGSWLVREYLGRRIEVKVLERGFEYDGQRYGSLTAVAKAVTGASWNGRYFFGLTTRKGKT